MLTMAKDRRAREDRSGQVRDSIMLLLLSGGFGIVLGGLTLISPLFSLVFIGLFAAGYYLILNPFKLIYLLLFAIIFTSAIPRDRMIPVLKINEIMLALSVGWLFIPRRDQRRPPFTFPGAPIAATMVLAIGTAVVPLISYQLRGFALSTSEILGLVAPLQYLCLFYFFALFPRTVAQRHLIIQLMWFLASMVAAIGLLQEAGLGPVTAFLNTWYPSGHTTEAVEYGRLTSVFGAWNVLGTFLMSVLVMALAFRNYPRSPLFRLNTRVMVLLVVPCLLATNSYASLIGLGMGFVILNLIQPRNLRYVLGIGLFVLVVGILLWPIINMRIQYQFSTGSLMPQTIQYRLFVWQKFYLPLIQREPIWGVSPNLDNVVFAYAESQYLYMAFHAGLVGIVSHLAWVGILLGWLFGVMQTGPTLSKNLGAAAFTLLIVYSAMGITNPVFTYSGSMDFFWISLGLIVNDRLLEQDAPAFRVRNTLVESPALG